MEYETINYDFTYLLKAISSLCDDDKKYALDAVKTELNKFFQDFPCIEAIYTENTDNEFFGVQIVPLFNHTDRVGQLFNGDKDVKFDSYKIEFDSKLFNGEFDAYNVLALIIHDINRLNTPSILKDILLTQ